ncbi:hypothetical protein EDB84DRAFT_891370 [Lactarius hengduanensis]|nr:hypothetical protein EDB84DRAFT_891370 [Lactarius hengduanensis]
MNRQPRTHTRAHAKQTRQASNVTASKQSEYHLPTQTHERVDPTDGVHEPPRVDRMDTEVPCPSFGVRPPAHLLPSLSSDRTCRGQSFAKIPPADTAQLLDLLDSAWQKVAGLKDAFERPFRTGTAGDACICVCVYFRYHLNLCTRATYDSISRGSGDVGRRMRIGVDAVSPPAPRG